MTRFLEPKFSVSVGGKAFSDGWERIFGKGKEKAQPQEEPKAEPDVADESVISPVCPPTP